MGVAVTAAGHHKTLACIIDHFGLTCLNIGLSTFLVAYINVLAVFHRKGFNDLIVFGSENLAIDHEVGTFIYNFLVHNSISQLVIVQYYTLIATP